MFYAKYTDFENNSIIEHKICLKTLKNEINGGGSAVYTVPNALFCSISGTKRLFPLLKNQKALQFWKNRVQILYQSKNSIVFEGFLTQISYNKETVELKLSGLNTFLAKIRLLQDFSAQNGTWAELLAEIWEHTCMPFSFSGATFEEILNPSQSSTKNIPKIANSIWNTTTNPLPCPALSGHKYILTQDTNINGQLLPKFSVLTAKTTTNSCPTSLSDFFISFFPNIGGTTITIPPFATQTSIKVISGSIILTENTINSDPTHTNGNVLQAQSNILLPSSFNSPQYTIFSAINEDAEIEITFDEGIFLPFGTRLDRILAQSIQNNAFFTFQNGNIQFQSKKTAPILKNIPITEINLCKDITFNGSDEINTILANEDQILHANTANKPYFSRFLNGNPTTSQMQTLLAQNQTKKDSFSITLKDLCKNIDKVQTGKRVLIEKNNQYPHIPIKNTVYLVKNTQIQQKNDKYELKVELETI